MLNSYSGIDYEKCENCFEKTKHIESRLIIGDLDYIREPWITVFIPTYKRADLLKDAINSVINQWHVPFFWDIVIVDNEEFDGKANDTEKLIREMNHPRILYYRNLEHMRPGDNFNRGIMLSRGKWVMMLHDDDILIVNSLQNMGRVIGFLNRNVAKPLGAVSAQYYQFAYNEWHRTAHWQEIVTVQNQYLCVPTNFWLYKLTHKNILFRSHIGGDIPSNGTTYNREAVMRIGGFNDDLGISADLILLYNLENYYAVYSTTVPYGFYRFGVNTVAKPESTYNIIKNGYDFREYVYSKNVLNKLFGKMFRASQYQKFTTDVIRQKIKSMDVKIKVSDFDDIYSARPSKVTYILYCMVISPMYCFFKLLEMKRLYRKSLKDKEIWK